MKDAIVFVALLLACTAAGGFIGWSMGYTSMFSTLVAQCEKAGVYADKNIVVLCQAKKLL